jgi:hypothetical protein
MIVKPYRNIMTHGSGSRFIGMRCHFNLVNSIGTIADRDGIEVQDIGQAFAQARKAIAELREEDQAASSDWADWSLEVTDASGCVLFSIDLDEVLH